MRTYPGRVATLRFLILGVLTILSFNSNAAEDFYIFSAPPRETPQDGEKTYGPIASYLSILLNKKIVYEHPGNWLSYSSNMRQGKYDVVFDGPHFVSWRISRLKHVPAVKIPGGFIFRFVTDKNNTRISTVDDLVGKRVCGHAPPNQGTLRLYDEFKNPMRLPILVPEKGWRNIYTAMMKGKCDAAILPDKIYKEVDPSYTQSKVLFTSNPVPGQAITVGPRFNRLEVTKIREALLSQSGQQATEILRKRFASPLLVSANTEEYDGIYRLLAHTHGFDVEQ